MARTLRSDRWLFLATLLLVGTSIVMVYSASSFLSMTKYGHPYYFLFKQLAWAVLGLIVLGIAFLAGGWQLERFRRGLMRRIEEQRL